MNAYLNILYGQIVLLVQVVISGFILYVIISCFNLTPNRRT